MPTQSEIDNLLQGVVVHLQLMDDLAGIPRRAFSGTAVSDLAGGREEDGRADECTGERVAAAAVPETVSNQESSAAEIAALAAGAEACRKCRLCETRTKVVFGVGSTANPAIVFVGEGPGADEDRMGEPFVGKAGALLTAAITKGMGLRREDVYICNVVKCRPPNNRTPLPDEVAACTPYLYRQLELLRPKVIVALGSPAQLALSGAQGGITKLRGRWQQWRDIKVMPTFHPAYILRTPSAKRDFWEDLKAVMQEVGLKVNAKEETA